MTKTEVRKLYLARRLALTPAELHLLNQELYHHLFYSVDFSFVKGLHIFLSFEKKNEPDTWQIIDRLRREFPNVRIIIPKISGTGTMDHFYFEGLHQLKPNEWGIMEPVSGIPAEPDKVDAVIVPLLACDMKGNRVGYGMGFYDRFLSQCRPTCKKIGLSFFTPIQEDIATNENDVPLDMCVSPAGVIKF